MNKGFLLIFAGMLLIVLGSSIRTKSAKNNYHIAPCIGKELVRTENAGTKDEVKTYKYTFYLHSYMSGKNEDMIAYAYSTEDFNSGKTKRYTEVFINEDGEYELVLVDNVPNDSVNNTLSGAIAYFGVVIGFSGVLATVSATPKKDIKTKEPKTKDENSNDNPVK